MTKFSTVFLFLLFVSLLSAQSPQAYDIFDSKGKSVKFQKMALQLAEADVVLFGEYHNNPISHWLQLELAKSLYELKKDELSLGFEMFESDNQGVINEYLLGLITESSFERDCRLWPNYKTDYKPLIQLAKDFGLKVIASNVPRRYAAMVSKGGFEVLNKLPEYSLSAIPPLPLPYDPNLPGYQEMLAMADGNPFFPQAQALKDATMAHFVLQNWEPGETCLHLNGAFHSNNFDGLFWYLKQYNPKLKIMTISTVSQASVDKLEPENEKLADFIIVVDEDMTSTH
jgi:uncharacterized iron-regulated protein